MRKALVFFVKIYYVSMIINFRVYSHQWEAAATSIFMAAGSVIDFSHFIE